MRRADQNGNPHEPQIVALQALVWVLGDDARACRLLALTGLDADQLRAGAADDAVLGATLGFLMAHEPDLVACAEALSLSPDELTQAARSLGQ